MSFDVHANLAWGSVAVAPSPATSGVSLTVAAGHGARFPSGTYACVVYDPAVTPTPGNAEIVRVTAAGGSDTLTVVRAQEGTTAKAIVSGWRIAATITAKALTDIEAAATGATSGTATVDFGTVEDGTASVTVPTPWVGASDWPRAEVAAAATLDHDPDDVAAEALTAYVTGVTAGVSTDVTVAAPEGTWGRYTVRVRP